MKGELFVVYIKNKDGTEKEKTHPHLLNRFTPTDEKDAFITLQDEKMGNINILINNDSLIIATKRYVYEITSEELADITPIFPESEED